MVSITLGSAEIRRNGDGLVSLTDLFKASGEVSRNKSPLEWARFAGAQFIEFVAESLNTGKSRIYKSTRGANGGTYAHWQVALAYAKYLSPDLHMQVNEVYARARSGDVTLADEIADKATPEQQEWLAKRVQGKVIRNQLTTTLKEHGVQGQGYGRCTNTMYKHLLGGTKAEICAARGIENKPSVSLRDMMTIEQLTATAMAELVARKQIIKYDAHGNTRCEAECDRAARNVAALLQ